MKKKILILFLALLFTSFIALMPMKVQAEDEYTIEYYSDGDYTEPQTMPLVIGVGDTVTLYLQLFDPAMGNIGFDSTYNINITTENGHVIPYSNGNMLALEGNSLGYDTVNVYVLDNMLQQVAYDSFSVQVVSEEPINPINEDPQDYNWNLYDEYDNLVTSPLTMMEGESKTVYIKGYHYETEDEFSDYNLVNLTIGDNSVINIALGDAPNEWEIYVEEALASTSDSFTVYVNDWNQNQLFSQEYSVNISGNNPMEDVITWHYAIFSDGEYEIIQELNLNIWDYCEIYVIGYDSYEEEVSPEDYSFTFSVDQPNAIGCNNSQDEFGNCAAVYTYEEGTYHIYCSIGGGTTMFVEPTLTVNVLPSPYGALEFSDNGSYVYQVYVPLNESKSLDVSVYKDNELISIEEGFSIQPMIPSGEASYVNYYFNEALSTLEITPYVEGTYEVEFMLVNSLGYQVAMTSLMISTEMQQMDEYGTFVLFKDGMETYWPQESKDYQIIEIESDTPYLFDVKLASNGTYQSLSSDYIVIANSSSDSLSVNLDQASGIIMVTGDVEGEYSITISLLDALDEPLASNSFIFQVNESSVNDQTFYFYDQFGNMISEYYYVGLNEELSFYVADANNMFEGYEVEFSYSENLSVKTLGNSILVNTGSVDTTYEIVVTIMQNEDFVASVNLYLIVNYPQAEVSITDVLLMQEGATYKSLTMEVGEESSFYVYLLTSNNYLIPAEYAGCEVSISDLPFGFNVLNGEEPNEIIVRAPITSGTYTFTLTLACDSDEVSQTFNVLVKDVEIDIPSDEFYFFDANSDEIVDYVNLELNMQASFYVGNGDGVLEGYEVVFYYPENELINVRNNYISLNAGNNDHVFSILAKIYHQETLIDSTVLTIASGTIGGEDVLKGEFSLANYNFTSTGSSIAIPFSCSNQELLSQNVNVNFYLSNEIGYLYVSNNQIIFEPMRSGYAYVQALFFVDGQFINSVEFNIKVLYSKESLEAYFNEGRTVQTLLSNNHIYLTIPQDYSEWAYYADEQIQLSTNRNVADVERYQEHYAGNNDLMVTLNGVGTTDIYLVYRSDEQQIVFKTTLIVVDEESKIQIDYKRVNDSVSALSKFDEIIFSVNMLNFQFSSNLTYEWYVDGALKSTDPTFTTTLPEGTHKVSVKFNDLELDLHLEAEKQLNVSQFQYQLRQLTFEEKEVHLLMLKNSYDLQLLIDGMISNEYQYTFSSDNDTVQLFANGSSKLTILPNHSGTTTIYAFVDIGIGEEKIISAEITVYVDRLEEISYTLSQEFPKPGKAFDIILLANGRDDYKNTDFQFSASANSEDVALAQDGNIIHVENPENAIYEINYILGNLEAHGSFKVSNFNFNEFLRHLLPIVLGMMVLVVIIYTVITRGLDPYRSITNTLNSLDETFKQELDRQAANPNPAALKKVFYKLHKKTKKLMNRIHYFSDEGFDGIETALKGIITLDTTLVALMHATATLDGLKAYNALKKTYEGSFAKIKRVITQTIDSQAHYQKQIIENNKEELPKKQKNVKKVKLDYKKELYENGLLDQVETEKENDSAN